MALILDREQSEKINLIGRNHGLRLVLLFGSAVTGEVREGSDLDVAVMFKNFKTANAGFLDLFADLQEVFPQREVDLVLINGADPLFLKKILESCVKLFGERRTLDELRMYSFRRYIDHKKYLAMESDYINRFLERFEEGAA